MQVTMLKGYADYAQMIRSHLLKTMAEDDRVTFRYVAVKYCYLGKLGEGDNEFFKIWVKKLNDSDVNVRMKVYERMLAENFNFGLLSEEDRLQFLITALHEPQE